MSQTKIERVYGARIEAEQFANAGGDRASQEAVPIGIEPSLAVLELAGEFGHPTRKEIRKKQ
jgi:hypothetical protein